MPNKRRKKGRNQRMIRRAAFSSIIAAAGLIFVSVHLFADRKENIGKKHLISTEEHGGRREKIIPETEASVSLEGNTVQKMNEIEKTGQLLSEIRTAKAGTVVSVEGLTQEETAGLFYAEELSDEVFSQMDGGSYKENPDIARGELRYLHLLHVGFDERTYVGELVVNQEIADKTTDIFRELYENRYPIEKMVLIDRYQADDEASMEENNTSAFNYRVIAGTSKLSNHSFGRAIDINPKYNPYIRTASDGSKSCTPVNANAYSDRTKNFPYKIDENDLAYKLFTQAGFTWGGNFSHAKDYQHFEYNLTKDDKSE